MPEITATATIRSRSRPKTPKGSTSVKRDERRDAAAERKRDQQRGFDESLGHAEAHACDRVIRRLLMGGEADAVGERRRHRIAVRRDEGDVPAGEPQAHRERERERGDEQDGKGE